MKFDHFLCSLAFIFVVAPTENIHAQQTHELTMTGDSFEPDTLYLSIGDSIHLVFDTSGHSMVQVPLQYWEAEDPDSLIGFALGEGTPNVGFEHTFPIDSAGTFYYLCEQHPEEKGVLIVFPGTGINEQQLPGFTIYPQPAFDMIRIDHDRNWNAFRIIDRQGRAVHAANSRNNAPIDISALATGIYVLMLFHGDEAVGRERVVISR